LRHQYHRNTIELSPRIIESVLRSTLHVICAAAHKKGAGVALTSQAALAHNSRVGEYVLDETVLFQPMTSGSGSPGFRSAT
jgi:hypothetical protein